MDHPYPPSPSERPPRDAEGACYREALHEMIGAGLAVTRAIRVQAEALSGVEDPGSEGRVQDAERVAAAFERVSRAVRFCIAQAQRLDEPERPKRPVSERVYGPGRKTLGELTKADLPELSDAELIEASARRGARPEARERPERAERAEDLMLDRPLEEVFGVILKDLEAAALAVAGDAGAWKPYDGLRRAAERLLDVAAGARHTATAPPMAAPRGGGGPTGPGFRESG